MKKQRHQMRRRSVASRLAAVSFACLLVISMMSVIGARNVANAATATWTTLGGSTPPSNVNSLVNVNGTLYAGTNYDVWTYSNGTWTQMSGSPSNVDSLLNVNGTLYAGTGNDFAGTGNDVWTYNGTWTQMSGSPSNVTSLLDDNGTLYAGTYNAIWKYNNGTWTKMSGSPGYVYSLLNVDGTLYGVTNNTVWTYSNGTWTQMSSSPSNVYSLLNVNGTLYAGTNNAVWTYNGTWTQMSGSPSNVYSLLNVNGTLYAGTRNGSNDVWKYNGTWTQMGGSPGYVTSLVNVNGTLYAGTRNGGNDVWTYSNGTWSTTPATVYSIASVNGTLYAGTDNGNNDVWKYNNGMWTPMSGSPGNVFSLLNVNGTLHAGTSNGSNDVWTYNNGTWTQMSGSPSNVNSLLDDNGTLYAGTNNAVWMYNGTWTQMSGSPGNVYSLLDDNGTLFAGTNNAVWMYNGTWTQVSGSIGNVYSLLNVNGTLYAGTSNSVWKYSNDTWTQMSGSPGYVYSLLNVNGTLYAAGANTAVWTYSNDTWTQMSGSPDNLNNLYYANGTLYAATGGYSVEQFPLSPDVPTNLQANTTTSTQTTLSWDTVPNTVSYSVYESVYGSGSYTPVATNILAPTYTVMDLNPGTAYTFTVSAVNGSGESAQSIPVAVNTASIGSAQMTLSSQNVLSGGTVSVTGVVYDVYQSPVANAVVDLTSSTGSWSLTGINSESVTADGNGAFAASWTAPMVSALTSATVTANVYGANVTPTVLPIQVAQNPVISATTLPTATAGSSYSHALTVIGGFSPYTWSMASGSLPSGLTLDNSTGVINGTPSTAGTSSFSVQVKDVNGNTATQNLSITVQAVHHSSGGSGGGGSLAPSSPNNNNVTSTNGTLTLKVGQAGEVRLENAVTITIPAGATNKPLKLTVVKVPDTQHLLSNQETLVSPVYEISKNFPDNFEKPVTLTFAFDLASLKGNQKAAVCYYDEAKKKWVEIDGTVNGNSISAEVNHFTKFAVFAVDQAADSPTNFSDISGHWAKVQIKKLVANHDIEGYPDGTFKPDHSITRAEFLAILAKATGLNVHSGKVFTDTQNHWAKDIIATAVASGIVNGYDANRFGPDDPINREQMAVMIANAFKLSDTTGEKAFTDDDQIDNWAKAAVEEASAKRFLNGYPDNSFHPHAVATRAEAAAIIVNVLGL